MPLRQAICMVKSHRNWPKFDLRLCNVSNAFNFAYVIAKSQIHLIHYKYIEKWEPGFLQYLCDVMKGAERNHAIRHPPIRKIWL